ncbi:MAG: hypothetical protein U9Q69_00640 [Nanoarchaeota archaeon]|nr:hypothetical protein [Nanoarchaeota archaeon]
MDDEKSKTKKELEIEKKLSENSKRKRVNPKKVTSKNNKQIDSKKQKELQEKLKCLNFKDLKIKLNELNKLKEEWFKKKEDFKKDIAKLIENAKDLRDNRTKFNKKINNLTKQRNKFNTNVHTLIKEIKELYKKRDGLLTKLGIKNVNLKLFQKQIDDLELRLETQAVSFDKEKKIMKEINSLKKKMASMAEVDEIQKQTTKISEEINTAKIKGDEFHNKIKELMKNQKLGFKEFAKVSKEINQLKKIQEDAFDKFINFKQEFIEANKILKERLKAIQKQQINIKKKREVRHEAKQKRTEETLKRKVEEVESKLKKKKILTNEDLIAFQAKRE